MLNKDNKTYEYEGQKYTYNAASKKQKDIERAIKNAQDRCAITKAAGDDIGYLKSNRRLVTLCDKYADFSKKTNLPTKAERLSLAKTEKLKKQAEVRIDKTVESGIIKEIRECGIKGDIIKIFPPKFDTSDLKYDIEHINNQRNHNVTEDEAKSFIENAVVMITKRQGISKNFFSYEGAAYVNPNEKTIKTAFSCDEYDEKVKAMLEVVKKYEK